ncbi:MAG: GspE/PulE family protein [Thermodesulfobacteriota bacterium]|nr:GspE/PulE family protein [Thermodesulfobacteriota bacterium]
MKNVASLKQEMTSPVQTEKKFQERFQDIGNKIYNAKNLDDLLINLNDDIADLFNAERVAIYAVDGKTRELLSKKRSGNQIDIVRVAILKDNIPGHVVVEKKLINIEDVYDDNELRRIDETLKFDPSSDQKTDFTTKQILATPIAYRTFTLGAIELTNCRSGSPFVRKDQYRIQNLAKILGIALFNQHQKSAERATKFSYLIDNNLISPKGLKQAITEAKKRSESEADVLVSVYKVSKRDVGKSLNRFYSVPFVEYNASMAIPGDLLAGLKIPFMRNNYWVPIKYEESKNRVIIAIDDPHDLQKIDVIHTLFKGKQIGFHVALRSDILEIINLFTRSERELAGIDDIISQLHDEAEEIEEAEASVGEEDSVVVQLVNKIVIDADTRGASDIHFEPYLGRESTQVRFRVDGQCYVYQTIPYHYRNAVISRLKIMSDLDIAERRLPQDGKIKFKKYGGRNIELRVATVPTQGGLEDVVLRILSAGEPIPLNRIGFSKRNLENFIKVVQMPYGIIFVCGPTGSGKTTTLHSALSYINKPETKIWTAEDPVEITQKGLRQVQVKPKIGLDFPAIMRSFLRADPDVIMVGEMRDKETTRIGIEASLTGHLVLSTLHTNSAPESITRLLDMGMDPFNFADAILGIMAQRLVRTLCQDCKKPYHPTRDEYDKLVRTYGQEAFEKNVKIPYSEGLTLYKPDGCDKCNNSGYMGRMAIHELLVGTDAIKRIIQTNALVEDVRNQALLDGMTTLKQDGIEKIFKGLTDLVQVRKVTIR